MKPSGFDGFCVDAFLISRCFRGQFAGVFGVFGKMEGFCM